MIGGSLGWGNPFPMEVGGGTTIVERHYKALKGAVGDGATSTSEDSVDALWRGVKATALATMDAFSERAAIETFPRLSTSLLPYYETATGSLSGPDDNLEQRRDAVANKWTEKASSDGASLEQSLENIDERFSLVYESYDSTATTIEGRPFEPFSGAPTYDSVGERKSTLFPQYSGDMIVHAVLSIGDGVPTGKLDERAIRLATDLLNSRLSGWVNFDITTQQGFQLDVSRLDLTGLGKE